MKQKAFWLLLCLTAALHGQKYANAFLDIGVDAASLGMAGNVTATVDNLNAAYWNPAGLMQMQGQWLSLMHARYWGGMAHMHFLGYGRREPHQALAVSLLRFGVDNIMNTTHLIDEEGNVDYNRITYFSAADYALLISYARPLPKKNLYAGLTAKILYRHIGDFASGYGLGFDAGLQYVRPRWKAGLSLRDISTTFSFWHFDRQRLEEIAAAIPGQNQSAPSTYEVRYPSVHAGVARRWTVRQNYHLWLEGDIHTWFDKRYALVRTSFLSLTPGLSLQGDYKNKVFVRAGFDRLYRSPSFGSMHWHIRPAAGLGIRFKYLQLDYALNDSAASGRLSHFFSLLVDMQIFKAKQ